MTITPPDNSQITSDEVRPAKDDGVNADMIVEPCGTSLSSDRARPPAIKFRCRTPVERVFTRVPVKRRIQE